MAATKDHQYHYSSEIGLVGEITQACLAVAARLIQEAPSVHVCNAKAEANGQIRPEASLDRKRSKLNTERYNDKDVRHFGDENRNESCPENISDVVQGPRGEVPAEHLATEVDDHLDPSHFGDILGQLRLWADGLEVSEGRLDKALERSTALKTAVFTVFIAITTLLTRACRDILHDDETVCSLQSLTEKASIVLPKGLLDDGESDHNDDDDQKDVLDFETLVEEFSDLCQDLFDLTPSLMDIEESRHLPEKGEENSSVTLQAKIEPEFPHDHFKRVILDKYPDAQPALVERLAKECWNLYISVRDGLIKRENAMKALALEDKDSAYESMLQSELAPSLIGRLSTRAIQEVDEASETTSLAEDSVQLKDRPKTPRPPVDLGPNIDFVCSICSRLQKEVSNTRAWRKHIFSDIRPYVCSFENCRQPVVRFATRSAWMQHEYAYHRQHLQWRCMYQNCPADVITFLSEDDFRVHMVDYHHVSITEVSELLLIAKTCRRVVASTNDINIDCPVCLLSIPNKRSKIGRHLGRHMEDIALPIISLVLPTDEDIDASDQSDEETSSAHENPQPERLFGVDDLSVYSDSFGRSAGRVLNSDGPLGHDLVFNSEDGRLSGLDTRIRSRHNTPVVSPTEKATDDSNHPLSRSPPMTPDFVLYNTSKTLPPLLPDGIEVFETSALGSQPTLMGQSTSAKEDPSTPGGHHGTYSTSRPLHFKVLKVLPADEPGRQTSSTSSTLKPGSPGFTLPSLQTLIGPSSSRLPWKPEEEFRCTHRGCNVPPFQTQSLFE